MPSCFLLDTAPPAVRLRAAYTKNGQEALQPLPPVLVEPLRAFMADKPAGKPVWPGPWTGKASRMIRQDEEDVAIAYKTDEGYADFHALQHTFITSLFRGGVHAKTAQARAGRLVYTKTPTNGGIRRAAAATTRRWRLRSSRHPPSP